MGGDLVSRLLAAIETEEQDAPNIHHKDCRSVSYVGVTEGAECDCGKPAAVLRHCKSDREIVDLYRLFRRAGSDDTADALGAVLRIRARAYGLSVEEETTHE